MARSLRKLLQDQEGDRGASDEPCGCRSQNECCAPGLPGCREDYLPRSLERDLTLVGDCEIDCAEQCQGACNVDHLTSMSREDWNDIANGRD